MSHLSAFLFYWKDVGKAGCFPFWEEFCAKIWVTRGVSRSNKVYQNLGTEQSVPAPPVWWTVSPFSPWLGDLAPKARSENWSGECMTHCMLVPKCFFHSQLAPTWTFPHRLLNKLYLIYTWTSSCRSSFGHLCKLGFYFLILRISSSSLHVYSWSNYLIQSCCKQISI